MGTNQIRKRGNDGKKLESNVGGLKLTWEDRKERITRN